jgi:hypothetical protein
MIRGAMTTAEHRLLITLFAKQLQLNRVLTEILKSRGIAQADDLQAFEFLVSEDVLATSDALQTAKKFYLHVAKSLGIDTGVTAPPG